MSKLREYHRKRDFSRTAEPAGREGRAEAGARRFVIHKHAARRLHYDLRLEYDGVYESWAVPKGLGSEPGTRRLAVRVEDHPLDYGDFEGTIPAGEYGGGTVMLWDRGHWRELGRSADRIDFELIGSKLRGRWTLARMRAEDRDDQWLVIRRKSGASTPPPDVAVERSIATGRTMEEIAEGTGRAAPADPLPDPGRAEGARRSGLPDAVRPQLATAEVRVPGGERWLHEIKFDGYRVLARLAGGDARLLTRNGRRWEARFPEIAAAVTALPLGTVILDGEIVALEGDGTSSFRRLQEAISSGRTATLVYQVFDLLYLEGYDLRGAALQERKELLGRLFRALAGMAGPRLRYTDHLSGGGRGFYVEACRIGLEGIISKRRDKPYTVGRNRNWLKIKCRRMEKFAVGGYTPPSGSRSGFGSLLVGAWEEGRLLYRGRVGSGFTAQQLSRVHARLQELGTDVAPFDPVPHVNGVAWVRPELVVEVEYTERTRDGRLRHPVFRGLLEDRESREITTAASRHDAPGRRPARAPSGASAGATVAGVGLTSPDRVVYPGQGVTKRELAEYYAAVAERMLPWVERRPLSLVRCPDGRDGECFFQKHPRYSLAKEVPRVEIEEKRGARKRYLYVADPADLVRLIQAGTLELHCWGSRVDDVERPDILVFDLDPGPDVEWMRVVRTARNLRQRLAALGLGAFVRTTGGKGLHVVVPLQPSARWDEAKAFSRALAQRHAREDPGGLTANMSKARREGRIFIDYLRNGRGATAIANYSTRARDGAPVAVPLRWRELSGAMAPDRYNTANLMRRLGALKGDPWAGFDEARRPLPTKRGAGTAAGARRRP